MAWHRAYRDTARAFPTLSKRQLAAVLAEEEAETKAKSAESSKPKTERAQRSKSKKPKQAELSMAEIEDRLDNPEPEMPAVEADADFFRDLEWAYAHFGQVVDRSKAPSNTAHYLLEWSSVAQKTFMDLCKKHFDKKMSNNDEDKELVDDRRKQFAILEMFEEVADVG